MLQLSAFEKMVACPHCLITQFIQVHPRPRAINFILLVNFQSKHLVMLRQISCRLLIAWEAIHRAPSIVG